MKRKVGDEITIKKDLDILNVTDGVMEEMLKHKGKTSIITGVFKNFYSIKLDNKQWGWSDGMLEQ